MIRLLACLLIFAFIQCKLDTPPKKEQSEKIAVKDSDPLPEWAKDATIYEVNIRQYSQDGTFIAFTEDLPRLKELGVEILWLMPIFPISEEKRKGELGSPYAVADYKDVNPEFGTMDDFKNLVSEIHDLDMKIILDWVPNHTGWDNPWITKYPDWYTQVDGEIIDPIDYNTGESWGWTDVADLNYENEEMRTAMIEALRFWIEDIGIDGYRMDVAHGVPDDFWNEVAPAVNAYKNVFMLSEGEVPNQRNSGNFDMDYGWTLHHLLNEIAQGDKDVKDLDQYFKEDAKTFTAGFHMNFTSNHDENTWAGTVFERMGDAHMTMAVLTASVEGMPLIYNGQEAPLRKRLEFFEKDPIDWGRYEYQDFYKTLNDLKRGNQALWNGEYGGPMERIITGNDRNVFAFKRENNGDSLVVILNLSNAPQKIDFDSSQITGDYNNVFKKSSISIADRLTLNLRPWDYMIFSNR